MQVRRGVALDWEPRPRRNRYRPRAPEAWRSHPYGQHVCRGSCLLGLASESAPEHTCAYLREGCSPSHRICGLCAWAETLSGPKKV